MKRFFPVLGLMLLALFHMACGTATPTTPAGPAAVNHNYPLNLSFGTNGSGNGQFVGATGIAVHNHTLFVGDYPNNRVEKFDLFGNWMGTLTGFNATQGIAFDSTGTMYVVNGSGSMVQPSDINGNLLTAWGTLGTGVGQLSSQIYGIAIDSQNRVYVADSGNNRIERCSKTGTGCVTIGGTTSSTADGQFNYPTGVAIDKSGNIWVTDSFNNRIQEFNSSLIFLQKWGTNGSGNGQFSGPSGILVDQDGNVIVSDSNNSRVEKLTPSGTFIQLIGTGWAYSYYSAVDGAGNLYITNNNSSGLPSILTFTPN